MNPPDCPKCGKALRVREGARGRFLACSGYPDCRYSRDMTEQEFLRCDGNSVTWMDRFFAERRYWVMRVGQFFRVSGPVMFAGGGVVMPSDRCPACGTRFEESAEHAHRALEEILAGRQRVVAHGPAGKISLGADGTPTEDVDRDEPAA